MNDFATKEKKEWLQAVKKAEDLQKQIDDSLSLYRKVEQAILLSVLSALLILLIMEI